MMRGAANCKSHRGERGSVFLLALVILTVILILGASLIEKAQTSVYQTMVDNRAAKSFHLAEGGIDKAMWDLNQTNGWLTYAGESGVALPGGFVDISVTPAPAQRGLFTETLVLVSTGYLTGPEGTRRLPRTVRVITHKDPRYFAYAVFGSEQVVVGNGTVTVKADSYTSDDGGYGGGNVAENADIGTNATGPEAVMILPQGEVHGNVMVGAGAAFPELCVDNKGLITGDITALDAPNLLPSITSVPASAIELGDIWLDGSQQLVLNEGTYHMTDLDVFGGAEVVCNGKVVIYMDQTTDLSVPEIRIGGHGIVNTSGLPANLLIYCLNDVVSITISGNGQFHGGIYAPNATIDLNSGEVFGSLVGKKVRMNGATSHVHYDQALRDHSNPQALMRSWEVL